MGASQVSLPAPTGARAPRPLLVALTLLTACGCSNGCGESGPEGTGGTSATGSTSSHTTSYPTTSLWTTSSSSTTTTTGSCPSIAIPDGVPAGWVEYPDWSCGCRFYVPPTAELLPAPIAWEPCPLSPDNIDCQAMVTDWTDRSSPVAYHPKLWTEPSGSPLLMFRRIDDRYALDVIAELDGAVRFSIIQVGDNLFSPELGCSLQPDGLNEGKFLYGTRGLDPDDPSTMDTDSGAIGGSLGELRPTLLAHHQTGGDNYDWRISGNWVMRGSAPSLELHVFPWSMDSDIFVTSAATDPEQLTPAEPVMSGDALFWESASLKRHGINVWDPEGGTRPFIRFLGDFTRGASNLGTDGVELVWSYGEGKAPDDWAYPVRSIMTAPFTTDPGVLQARRLRSDPNDQFGGSEWQVGCGYAAHEAGVNNVIVVRLSDGVSWLVPTVYPDQVLGTAIGVTCEDVIILGNLLGKTNIVRVRLDSLGPGIPPD